MTESEIVAMNQVLKTEADRFHQSQAAVWSIAVAQFVTANIKARIGKVYKVKYWNRPMVKGSLYLVKDLVLSIQEGKTCAKPDAANGSPYVIVSAHGAWLDEHGSVLKLDYLPVYGHKKVAKLSPT